MNSSKRSSVLAAAGQVAFWAMTCFLLSFASCSAQQTNSNIDDSLANWHTCIKPSCDPGGIGTPTSTTQTINNASPSLDGEAMAVTVNTAGLSSGQTTNALWYYEPGARNSSVSFVGAYHIYVASTANITALEYDQFQFVNGTRYMFGSQCVIGGFWQIWNQLTGSWVNTSVACSLSTSTWHTIIWNTHRVDGDVSCSGHPCMYYDSLQVDSNTYTGFTALPSGPTPFGDNTGIQVQIDVSSAGGTATEYLDQFSLTQTDPAAPVGALYNNDSYCGIDGVPTWGASDGPSTLPTTCYPTNSSNTPATGAVVNVTANSPTDLQAKLTAAACGQKITLPAGSVYSGNFTLPALVCPSNNYLWIESSGVASLPAESARYSTPYNSHTVYAPQFGPCYAGVTSLPGRPSFNCPGTPGTYTAQLITPNLNPALTLTAGTSGVRFIGLEFTRATGTGLVLDLIQMANLGSVDHIIFDRMWCHGTELGDETNRCLRDSAVSYMGVIDSYFSDFLCVSVAGACTDSKAIGGGTNTNNAIPESTFKIVNNYLEAAGENTLHGGDKSNTVPSNFEIRLNLFLKPMVWNPLDVSYNGGYKGGHPVVVKNLMEFKNGQFILVEGNQYFNLWAGFTQHGDAITITPANQNTNLCPVCKVENLTMRYNLVSTANGFGDFTEAPNLPNSVPAGGNHYSIHDNVADNLFYCGVDGKYCPHSQSLIQIVTNSVNITTAAQTEHDLTFDHNTWIYAAGATSRNALGVSGPTVASGANMYNITFTNNLYQAGGGITNSSGGATNCANGFSGSAIVTNCWVPTTWGTNCIVNNGIRTWPGVNITSVADYSSVFTNYNNGNGGDYTVAAGDCKGAGAGGTDPGANIALLNSRLTGVTSSSIVPKNSTAFGITMFAVNQWFH